MRAALERALREGRGIQLAKFKLAELEYLTRADLLKGPPGWRCLNCGHLWQERFTDARVPGIEVLACAHCGTVAP